VDSRVPPEELARELDEEDVLSAGMATFRCREFTRAAHTLGVCLSAKGRFLSLYSQYLVGVCFHHPMPYSEIAERPAKKPLCEIGINSTVGLPNSNSTPTSTIALT